MRNTCRADEMPRRLKLIVAYDGMDFAGWQSQAHRNTIQDQLERAFHRVSGEEVRVHGAGRTDAGVHALGQCAHVDVTEANLSASDWSRALNALLPPSIRVMRSSFVSNRFHARLSATGKVYRYRLWSGPVLPPHEHGRAWHLAAEVEFDKLQKAAQQFIGTHNFAAFAANRGHTEPNTTRTIHSVRIQRRGACVNVEFCGEAFLYKMVRLMVGSIVQCALGKETVAEIANQLATGKSSQRRLVAPAAGLFLVRVRY
ncbi:MAG TPA: tRNA pseudouridine(38-40) synthase TruA [Chthoniobacterales bacterium]|jgi:tRNA pseudouridine38-40 synthase|nr:tRNA pseudouridine(38-40) synthase TruA [Chthoniobacterales bacterium]